MALREDVLVMLNEREPLKREKAEELEAHCRQRGLCCSRLAPSAESIELLQSRAPRTLILDYILGDFGTALEVLQILRSKGTEATTKVLLWTDEPSVKAAVSTMKLGACDFIEINSPRALEKLLEAIDAALQETAEAAAGAAAGSAKSRRVAPPLDTPIYQAPQSRPVLNLARDLARRNQPVVVIEGSHGAGRNTLGRFIHDNRQRAGLLHEIDFAVWDGSIAEIFGDRRSGLPKHLLAAAATVLIDHVEFDPAELLQAAEADFRSKAGGVAGCSSAYPPDLPMLILATTSAEVANAAAKLLETPPVQIPDLSSRRMDFLPLLQQLATELAGYDSSLRFLPSPSLVEQLSQLDWPGNIKQLRAVVTDAVSACHNVPAGKTQLSALNGAAVDLQWADLSPAEQLLMGEITAARARWKKFAASRPYIPDAYAVLSALEQFRGSERLAAAALGTGVAQLRAAIKRTGAADQAAAGKEL